MIAPRALPGLAFPVALFRQLLTLLLVITLMPGVPELLEAVDHLAHEGHVAHSSAHSEHEHQAHDDAAIEAEHGCTTLVHTCGCHVSMPAVLPAAERNTCDQVATLDASAPIGTDQRPVSWANAPPVRPPIG